MLCLVTENHDGCDGGVHLWNRENMEILGLHWEIDYDKMCSMQQNKRTFGICGNFSITQCIFLFIFSKISS